MPAYSEFDIRMKKYESVYSGKLLPRVPAVIRVDGKAFHTYTKTMEKPFSKLLHLAMEYAIVNSVKQMSGVKAVYTQSDEISFWLSDQGKSVDTQGWFDWKVQKLTSLTASIFTYYFNEYMTPHVKKTAFFDARAFSLPDMTELNNYFLWREKDATKNSIAMLAQSQFSHKSLQGLNTCQMQDKLMLENEVNWNNLDAWKKRGSLYVRVMEEKDVTYIDGKTGEEKTKEGVKRTSWKEAEFFSFSKTPIYDIVAENIQNKID
jgi:tRNA(His) 5'-end guanylyltransferase